MTISGRSLPSVVLLSFLSTITFNNTASASPLVGGAGSGTILNNTNGNVHWVESIYPGNGPFALEMTLQYNSRNTIYQSSAGVVGRGWSHSYSSSIVHFRSGASGSVIIEFATVLRADGKRYTFKPSAGAWVGKTDAPGRLNRTTSGWTWTTRDGTVETYDTSGKLLTITDPQGLVKTLTYDTNNRLTKVAGPSGQALTFAYDASNLLSTLTDAAGWVTTLSYDAKKNLTRVGSPDTTAKVYHYENTSFLSHLTGLSYNNGAGIVTRDRTIGYDGSGRAVSEQRAGGMERFTVTQYGTTQVTVMDAVGTQRVLTLTTNQDAVNITAIRNLTDNKTLTQTFDANNNLTCKQDEEGRVVTYTYNTTNQKVSETSGQTGTCSAPVATSATRTTTYQYLSPTLDLPTVTESPSVFGTNKKRVVIGYTNNLPTSITQSGFTPSGTAVTRAVTMTYNTLGQVTSINGPRSDVADVTTLAYNVCTSGGGCGQLRSVTNALNQITTYDSYDPNGRVLSMTDPNGLKTIYTYTPRGRVETITQTAPGGLSRVTSYGYNAAGNIIATTLPTGLSLTYTYDAAQYLRRVTDSLGNYITYGYDLKGNRTQTATYDAAGTLVRAIDLTFNARNHVDQLNAGGSITKQVWDALGNLTAVTNPNTVASGGTAATTQGYDALNRLLTSVDLLSGVTQYSYDPNDRVKTVTAANGSLTQYQYDDLGNLLKEISPDRGTVSYAYDAAGNLVSQTDARGIVVGYSYDALNRLSRMDYPGTIEDVTHTYDSGAGCSLGVGRLCAVVDAGGTSTYHYDGFGNVVSEQRNELGVLYATRYAYDAGNRITSISYPNGRVVNYTRNAKGDVQTATMTLNGVTTTLLSSATYRPDGLPLTTAFGNTLTDTRTYDTQGRLTYQAVGSADTRLYGYDANGNLTNLQSLPQVGTYAYDVLDRLKQEARTTQGTLSTAFTFDANGNRKTETGPNGLGTYAYLANSNRLTGAPGGTITLDAAGNTTSDGSRSYSYNQAGQLAQVNGAGYSYNAKRQRSRKIVGAQGTVYHYDLTGNLIAETRVDGNLIRDYVWVGSLPVAQIEAGGRISYLHGDHLNTPRLATNASGVKVWSWEGEAFGNTQPTGTVTINLRFPGTYYDAETSLWLNGARFYDPRTGRFITADPMSVAEHVESWRARMGVPGQPPLELNPYARVVNNPLRWIDPDGQNTIAIGGGIGAAVGGPPGAVVGAIIGAGIGVGAYLISEQCKTCPPCTPPVGTIGYRLDTTHPHGGMMPHVHLFERQQDPRNCHCFWKKIGVTSPPPPPGAVPM